MTKRKKESPRVSKDKGKQTHSISDYFLFQKQQRIDLIIFTCAFVFIYFFLSINYPYPDVFPDTGNYILTAKNMVVGGFRPIGYSWFLNFFHSISESAHFLFFAQYFLHVISTLILIFTLKYFFRPANNLLYYIIAFILIFSPGVLYLTNYIMSDTIFNSLTMLYISSLVWFGMTEDKIKKILLLLIHLVILYLAFNVRYVALFYPVLSMLFILMFYKNKFIGSLIALLPFLVIIGAYNKTKKEMKKYFGVETFSGFSGWALANNAVSIIPDINLRPEQINDKYLSYIHSVIIQFDDSVYKKENILETDFMWKNDFPGKQVFARIRQASNLNYVTGWVYMGELYNQYALMLIKKYPLEFFKNFIVPNILQILKYFEIPNPTIYKPDSLQKEWFKLDFEEYKYESIFFASINPIVKIGSYIRMFLFIVCIGYLILKFRQLNFTENQKRIVLLFLSFILLYFIFSVITHPINNFRYLIPTYIFMFFTIYITVNQVLIKENITKLNKA